MNLLDDGKIEPVDWKWGKDNDVAADVVRGGSGMFDIEEEKLRASPVVLGSIEATMAAIVVPEPSIKSEQSGPAQDIP